MCYNVEEMVVCTRKCFPHILKMKHLYIHYKTATNRIFLFMAIKF